MNSSGKVASKFLYGKGIFTLLRSGVASQVSSWTDMILSFVFYAWVFLPLGTSPWRSSLATAIGLIVGGIVNCTINYKFAFRAEQCSIKAVIVKFLLIWAGSFILNIGGTTGLNHIMQQIEWFREIGMKPDGIFAAARLSVSLVVSLAWNFLMYKYFVYTTSRFDPYAIRLANIFCPRHKAV